MLFLFLQSIYLEISLESLPFVFFAIMIIILMVLVLIFGRYCFDYKHCSIKTVKGVVVKAMVQTGIMTFPTSIDSSLCSFAPLFQAIPYDYNYMEAKAECEDGIITFEGDVNDDIFKKVKEGDAIMLSYKEGHKNAVEINLAA